MEVGRTLAGRRGSSIPGEPIVVNVDANHTHWFYDTLCSRAERVITTGYAFFTISNAAFKESLSLLILTKLRLPSDNAKKGEIPVFTSYERFSN